MNLYLYRAVSTENIEPEEEWEHAIWVGMPLGRETGYLSRSSAKDAGERSGIDYRIERSQPIQWAPPRKDRMRSLAVALADLVLAGNETAAKVVAVQVLDRAEGTS